MYNNVQDVACQTAEDVCLPESQLFSIFFMNLLCLFYYDAYGLECCSCRVIKLDLLTVTLTN